MANQVADNLSIINSIYYANVNPTQVHSAYNRMVFNAYGKNTLMGWIQMNSGRKQVPAMSFLHVENDRLQLSITSKTTNTLTGAGNAALVTLGGNSSYLNSGTYAPVQVGYKISDGVNWYTITALNTATPYAWVMTLVPDLSSVQVAFTAGQNLFIGKQVAVLEGSSATQNSIRGEGVTFTNYLQTFRRDAKFTGQSLAQFSKEVTFFDYDDPLTGEPASTWRQAEVDRVMLEMTNAKEVYCILGQAVTNSAVSATYGTGTTGVIPAIKAYGNTKTYSKGAGWQVSDFEDLSIVMEKNNSVDEYLLWSGIELNNDQDLSIKDFFPNGAVTYGAFGGDSNAAAGFGFDSFRAFGRTFHKHRMEIFNRPDFLGANFATTGSDYIGSAICLPAGKAQGVGGGSDGYINICTLAGNGFEYGYKHWVVDGMGWFGTPVTDQMSTLFCFADTYGVEVNAAKQMFYIQRTN